jgi:yersiniabactin nonribosomal peptide synthetase
VRTQPVTDSADLRSSRATPLAGRNPTPEEMRRAVAEMLDTDPADIGDDDDLVVLGMDSIGVIQLAGLWRRNGSDVTFAELIEQPTLGAWRALLRAQAAQASSPVEGVPPAGEVDESAPFDLAPMQQAYWIGRRQGQILGQSGAHYYVEFDGAGVDPPRLERAVNTLTARHGMLRASFLEDGHQRILPKSPWPGLRVHDFRDAGHAPAAGSLERLRTSLAQRRLSVGGGEVFDVQLSLLPDGATRLHVNIDMLVSDAQSFQLLLGDLARLYADPAATLPPIGYSFPRYIAALAERRPEPREQAQRYWAERLDDMPGAPQLPLAIEPDRLEKHGVDRRYHWIAPDDRRLLANRAHGHGLTLPVVFATAFAEVLAAWSAEPTFLLNLPLFDREILHPDVPRLVGDFSNLVVLAVDASRELPFAQQALALQRRLRDDVSHAEYSGLEVLRDLGRSRPGDWMMAPVVFTSVIGMGELFGAEVRRCFGVPGWMSSQTPQVWLDQQVTEHDGGLLVNWDVVEELFPDGLIDAMFGAYVGLLRRLGTGPAWVEPLPPMLPAGQARIRAAVNETAGPAPEQPLHAGFFEQAALHPERNALLWRGGGTLAYATLADRALRIAALLGEHGVEPGDAVAVTLPRGPDQIAAVLGVLAAGAAYVPVGIDQPAGRRTRIFRNAGVRVALTPAGSAPEREGEIDAVAVGDAWTRTPAPAPVPLDPAALAYVIYTSGSTGEPKGVEVTHGAAMNTVADINDRFHITAADRVLAVSALDFDLSVYDMFGLLSAGGALVLVDEEDRREARRWVELARDCGVTVWNSVPALLDMFLIAASDEPPPGLRLALVSGDWIGLDLPGRCAGCQFVALGGATEAAIWSNAMEVMQVPPHWRSIPYGFPLRNQRYRVVDARGRDCPDWVHGELWIGGTGVARGYRGDPERTRRQFVDYDGQRWYRTGDIGRYRPDGSLEFLGRADHQVKIRGHRIELGEVEAALEAHPGVLRAAVATAGERAKRIVAAVTAHDTGLDAAEVAPFLADRLPAYMLPADLVVLADIPLTANGKIDIATLVESIDRESHRVVGERPRGPVEDAVARLWERLLGVREVERGRSFFTVGGDSLIATRLMDALRDDLGVEVSLRQFFTAPTVAGLAALIVTRNGSEAEGMEEGAI